MASHETNWIHYKLACSIDEFIDEFFPMSKAEELKENISLFHQEEDDTSQDAWTRFKRYLYICPRHGLKLWEVINYFVSGLNYTKRMWVDAAAGGDLQSKTTNEAQDIIARMATKQKLRINKLIAKPLEPPAMEPEYRKIVEEIEALKAKVETLIAVQQ